MAQSNDKVSSSIEEFEGSNTEEFRGGNIKKFEAHRLSNKLSYNLNNIGITGLGGFSTLYKAIWKDMMDEVVVLKSLNNMNENSNDFLNEWKYQSLSKREKLNDNLKSECLDCIVNDMNSLVD
ncbi:kinase-like domain-containing protein [Rhizophagus irregularis DAOM 181602=DAOM 197198]|nr:kinase-like domain-containing protein [Rhizophagus irregularis DAOM 181602=DAOM 197198]